MVRISPSFLGRAFSCPHIGIVSELSCNDIYVVCQGFKFTRTKVGIGYGLAMIMSGAS